MKIKVTHKVECDPDDSGYEIVYEEEFEVSNGDPNLVHQMADTGCKTMSGIAHSKLDEFIKQNEE